MKENATDLVSSNYNAFLQFHETDGSRKIMREEFLKAEEDY